MRREDVSRTSKSSSDFLNIVILKIKKLQRITWKNITHQLGVVHKSIRLQYVRAHIVLVITWLRFYCKADNVKQKISSTRVTNLNLRSTCQVVNFASSPKRESGERTFRRQLDTKVSKSFFSI